MRGPPTRGGRLLRLLLPVWLLLGGGPAGGQNLGGYTPPAEVTDKDLSPLYGRYVIYEADQYRGSIGTTDAEAQAWVGQEVIFTADLFQYPGLRIENPRYTVWYYPLQPEGHVTPKHQQWSSFYYGYQGDATGDEVISVDRADGDGPWKHLELWEINGTNELWIGYSGYYYKARQTRRAVVAAGHEDYCRDLGPCNAGQGDCDTNSECQGTLTCTDNVGATYGWAAAVDVCEGPLTTVTQSIYLRAATLPATRSGGTATEKHVPTKTGMVGDWLRRQHAPTETEGVYRSQRTASYRGGVFQSATEWGVPELVVAARAGGLCRAR